MITEGNLRLNNKASNQVAHSFDLAGTDAPARLIAALARLQLAGFENDLVFSFCLGEPLRQAHFET